MIAGHSGSGIYLMGYSAEMVLKYAYFRVAGAQINDPVLPLLRPARDWCRLVFPQTGIPSHDGYHSIGFWAMLLWLRRLWAGRPFVEPFATRFAMVATRLSSNWWVEMRYRPIHGVPIELHEVYSDATWLLEHAAFLWS